MSLMSLRKKLPSTYDVIYRYIVIPRLYRPQSAANQFRVWSILSILACAVRAFQQARVPAQALRGPGISEHGA